jgi:hypothetical protein
VHVAHRRAVEVAVALDPAVQRDDGVVDGAGELAIAHQAGMCERVAAGPVHLRRAAQRVGVLYAGAVPGAVAGHDGRPSEQCAQVGGAVGLAGVRAQRLQVRGEHRVGTELGLDAHGGGEVSRAEQHGEVAGGERQHAEHAVDAVGEGQALLLAQHDRRDPGRGQRTGGRQRLAADPHGALAHRGERTVGQGSEIARAAQRSELVHDGRDPGVEHCRVGLGGLQTHASAAGSQRRQAQQHQRADDLALDLRAGARRVRTDEAALQGRAVIRRDLLGGQRAEPGGDAVMRLRVAGQRLDDVPARGDGFTGLVVQAHPRATTCGGEYLLFGQRLDADFDLVHSHIVRRGLAVVTSSAAFTVWDYRFIWARGRVPFRSGHGEPPGRRAIQPAACPAGG